MKIIRSVILASAALTSFSAHSWSPQIPSSTDYSSLSADQQRDLEAAAFLLNLRALGILDAKGPICAMASKDRNGNPSFQFSVQGDAFETGSCALKSDTSETTRRLQKLAQAANRYYRDVRGWKGKVPLEVYGFSDGQNFKSVGPQATQACPELARSQPVNGSYNLPLAKTRADRVAAELGLKDQFDVRSQGFSSPSLEKRSLACSNRRQVVIALGGFGETEQVVKNGAFEPPARIDDSVQYALNAGVSLRILQAHEKTKSSSSCQGLTSEAERSRCQWQHLQKVLTELGIAENDVACRAPTLALANEIISRADSAFAEGKANSALQNEMLEMARNPSSAERKLKAFITGLQSTPQARKQLTRCGSSAALHIAVPTSDMLAQDDPTCAAGSMVNGFMAETQALRSKLREMDILEERIRQYPSNTHYKANREKLRSEIESSPVGKTAGITAAKDLAAYAAALRKDVARRNLSHNCVKPDPSVLAIGYELSPNRDSFFRDPASLGKEPVELKYSAKSFSNAYSPSQKGYGCSECGSGIWMDNGNLKFANGVANAVENGLADLRSVYDQDGLHLLKVSEPTAATFLAPSLYEIPNCAGCSCLSSMKDAMAKAFAKGPLLRSVDLKIGASRKVDPKTLSSSCLFTPAVAHACPVGPKGHGDHGKAAGKLDTRLKYIDRSLNLASVSVAGDLRKALETIVKSPCACDVGAVRPIADYQAMVDEVSCDTRKPPVRLPTPSEDGDEKDCATAKAGTAK